MFSTGAKSVNIQIIEENWKKKTENASIIIPFCYWVEYNKNNMKT